MQFKKDDKVCFGRSMQHVGIVLEATGKEITVSHVELGCLLPKPLVVTFAPDDSVQLISAGKWLELTQNEPAFADAMTRDRFISLQRELEGREEANAAGHDDDEGDFRIQLIEMLMEASPWLLHPDYGCITKNEATLIEALQDVSQQLREHPDAANGNSKVHYCYHKADSALKTAADRRVMP